MLKSWKAKAHSRDDLTVVIIEGGFRSGVAPLARIGGRDIWGEPNEPLDTFKPRMVAQAKELGDKLLVIGGMPKEGWRDAPRCAGRPDDPFGEG